MPARFAYFRDRNLLQPMCASCRKTVSEQSQTSWAYYQKVVKTNEVAESVIIAFPVKFAIHTFFKRVVCKIF